MADWWPARRPLAGRHLRWARQLDWLRANTLCELRARPAEWKRASSGGRGAGPIIRFNIRNMYKYPGRSALDGPEEGGRTRGSESRTLRPEQARRANNLASSQLARSDIYRSAALLASPGGRFIYIARGDALPARLNGHAPDRKPLETAAAAAKWIMHARVWRPASSAAGPLLVPLLLLLLLPLLLLLLLLPSQRRSAAAPPLSLAGAQSSAPNHRPSSAEPPLA